MKKLLLIIALLITTVLLSCEEEEYCVECITKEYTRNIISQPTPHLINKTTELKCQLTDDGILNYEKQGTYDWIDNPSDPVPGWDLSSTRTCRKL